MSEIIHIKKGLNIPLKGDAEKQFAATGLVAAYALKPGDFRGINPRLVVKEGDLVKAGIPVLADKQNEKIKIASPVSGTVTEIRRGEKRVLLEVVITPDHESDSINFGKADPSQLSREQLIERLLESGAWPYIRQRPYTIIANPYDVPKAIFISAFDTAPLAPDIDFFMENQHAEFQKGIDVLQKLTSGLVYLNIHEKLNKSPFFKNIKNVTLNTFTGPHPAGNVGVQIYQISPINKGDIYWTIQPQDVLIIGRLFNHGIYDASRIICVSGSEALSPAYYKVIGGTNVAPILKNQLKGEHTRIISGNVLTGTKIDSSGFLGFYHTQLTLIPEGNKHELFGWAKPGFDKFSFSKTFLSKLIPDRKFALNTNLHGGERAYVITGQYEKVLPMDIYPMHLIKACLIQDIELMEKLGIYEVDEEDFALCEFIDISKTNIQEIIRSGINLVHQEMS